MSKLEWKYGENASQKYYDVHVGKDYLCVFANKWQPQIWMGCYEAGGGGLQMIHDKTRNDRQRKKQGLQLGCDIFELRSDWILCSHSPEYMMKKVEYCYKHRKIEVCA